jgi:hypothetical protein
MGSEVVKATKCPGCENEPCGSAVYYADGRFAGCDRITPPNVDAVCYCSDCEKGGENGRYTMRVVCGNCRGDYTATFRAGDKTRRSLACPICGVSYEANYTGLAGPPEA